MFSICPTHHYLMSINITKEHTASPAQLQPVSYPNTAAPSHQSHSPANHYSILIYFMLCLSTAESRPSLKSSNFLCPLLSLAAWLPVAAQSSLQRCISLTTDLTPFICHSVLPMVHLLSFHSGHESSSSPFPIDFTLDYVCHSGSMPNDGVTDSIF